MLNHALFLASPGLRSRLVLLASLTAWSAHAALPLSMAPCPGWLERAAKFFGYDWKPSLMRTLPVEARRFTLMGESQNTTLLLSIWGNRTPIATPLVPQAASWILPEKDSERLVERTVTAALENLRGARVAETTSYPLAFQGMIRRTGRGFEPREDKDPVVYPTGDRHGSSLWKQAHGPAWLSEVPLVPLLSTVGPADALSGYLVQRVDLAIAEKPGATEKTIPLYVIYDGPEADETFPRRSSNRYLRIVAGDARLGSTFVDRITASLGGPQARAWSASVEPAGAHEESPLLVAPSLLVLLSARLELSRNDARALASQMSRLERRLAATACMGDYFQKKIHDGSRLGRHVLAHLREARLQGIVENANDLLYVIQQSSGFQSEKRNLTARLDETFARYEGVADHHIDSEFELFGKYSVRLVSDDFSVRYRIDPDGSLSLMSVTNPRSYRVIVKPLARQTVSDAEVSGLANYAVQALLRVFTVR